MVALVKALAPVKQCFTCIGYDHRSTIGVDVGSNLTPSVVLVMLRVIRPTGSGVT